MEDSISGSPDQFQTLLHYTVYALSNTRIEILNFFGNWIVIFIINYFYGIFGFLVRFAAKILQFLGFLRISCYLETTLKACEISEDLKKILERWQHCINMTNIDVDNGNTRINGIWNSPNNKSTQTNIGEITYRLETRSLEETKTKDPTTEDLISRLADQTQTLLHHTVHALSNTRMKILNFFGNWIIIFIIDYFMEFSLSYCSLQQKFYYSWDLYEYL